MLAQFMTCCQDGEVEDARQALLDGQDPNERDEDDGCTGLMLAVQNKQNEILELLIEQPEIDINCVSKKGNSVLHFACLNDNPWAIEKLGSDPRIKKLNSGNNVGITPLLGAVMLGNVDSVRELVKFPEINLFGSCDKGRTLLGYAVIDKDNAIVELLLKQPKLDINSVNKIGDTALHVAGFSGNLWAVKKLVSDPRIKTLNSRNNDGQTPLIGAVRMGDVDCVRELVKIPGVDLHKISPQGRTLEEMVCDACDENEPKVIDKKAEIVSMIKNARNARLKKNKVFVQYCMDGKVEEAKQALIDGQDPNEKAEEYHSCTPLALAVIKKQNVIVELLLEQPQIDLNCANNNGDTALHDACFFNNPLAVANLGSDPRIRTVNSRNKNGVKPLMHAVENENVECVREVVKLPGIHLFMSYLSKHTKQKTREITLEDITCKLVKSKKKKEIKSNILSLLQNARLYWDKCEYCDYTSDKRSNLNKHVKETHKKLEQKPLCCNHCDFTTVRQGDLKKHIKETHEKLEQKLLHCNYCDYTTVRQGDLKKHINENHEKLEQNLLHCNHCDYTNMRQGNLNRHMLTHANKIHKIGQFKCDKCDFSDDKKNRLTQHLKRKHLMVDNVFECRECDFRTLLENELGKHIKEQHSKKHKI